MADDIVPAPIVQPPVEQAPHVQPPINTSLKLKKRLWLGLRSAKCDPNKAKLWFFWGNNFNNSQVYELDQANNILEHPEFRPERPTVLYAHGYVESMGVESIHVIVTAYQVRADHNIIILDWAELADGNYLLDAVINVRSLGPRIAQVLLGLFDAGLALERFHLVGHSLGGQLSGKIGRSVKELSAGQRELPRISALDPAFPAFYPGPHISASDARMVDVIHTDAWLYGAPVSTGSVDFWPNSGKTLQPGCPTRTYQSLSDNDLCSHRRSWRFWADSVANKAEKSFPAVRARNWSAFRSGRIDESQIAHMGIDCEEGVKGDWYLQTNGELPFSRGSAGIHFEKTPTNAALLAGRQADTDDIDVAVEALALADLEAQTVQK